MPGPTVLLLKVRDFVGQAFPVASVKQVYIRGVVKVLIDASARVRLVVSISLVRWTAQDMVLRPRSTPSSPAPSAHRCAAAGR